MTHEELLKFAQALLAENTELRKLVTSEREACAKVCEEMTASWSEFLYNEACGDCANAIRNRGQA